MYAPALVWYLLASYRTTKAKPGSREQLDTSPETP